MNEKIFKERNDVCGNCEFRILDNCSLCGCPNVGQVYNIDSHCPANKWSDGWGEEVIVTTSTSSEETTELHFDEESGTFFSTKELRKEIAEQSDPLYIFKNEEEVQRFMKLKNILLAYN